MTSLKNAQRGRVREVIATYGKCMELISMDPNFHEITVGLYVKDGIGTVWTFSGKPGVEKRVEEIRDQLVTLGGMVPVDGTHNQATFPDGEMYDRPLRFLLRQAVEKPYGTTHPEGRIEIKDLRSPLQIITTPEEIDGRWIYRVTAEGEYKNPKMRVRAVTQGFVRYGEMEKVDVDAVTFPPGGRRDELIRLVLPYARNVTGTADMLEAEALRGQMTTGTLGFAQT
ncbi:MAG: hypothetical protein F4Y50_02040 [Dehalococcoidia bacterium]|nr:hypothetical protein [Dehalococcoidia bacterium]